MFASPINISSMKAETMTPFFITVSPRLDRSWMLN